MYDSVRATSLVLRKQHLVPLTFGGKPSDVPRIVSDVCGLQWDSVERENPDWVMRNRFTEYRNDWLENSISDRSVVEFRLMRGSPYFVPSQELPYYFAATREVVKKISYSYFKLPFPSEIGEKEKKVLSALKQHAPATQSELNRKAKLAKKEFWEALFNLDNLGHIVRAGWRGTQNLWYPVDEWLPNVNLQTVTREEGEEYLTVKFFKAAGPSTRQCLSQWIGWTNETTTRNVDKLVRKGTLVELNRGHSESLIALQNDINELSGYLERDSTVRFLSPFDPYFWMRKSLLWSSDFSLTNVRTYSVVIGGIVAASFRVATTKKMLSVADLKVFQKSLISSRSAEIRREIEMHAASTNRSLKFSSRLRALL